LKFIANNCNKGEKLGFDFERRLVSENREEAEIKEISLSSGRWERHSRDATGLGSPAHTSLGGGVVR